MKAGPEAERLQWKRREDYGDAWLARQALQGRLVEIGIELRKLPRPAIRKALEHERHLICAELEKCREKGES